VPIKRIASIVYGIGEPPSYQPEGTPLIRATNVDCGQIRDAGLVFVNPDDIPAKRIVWLRTGDIIVVRSGAYTGDSAIIPSNHENSIAGFDMVLRCRTGNPQFIQYCLLSTQLKQGQIDLMRMRAAQPHLNAEELGSVLLPLPSGDEEQAAIVRFLDSELGKLDALVAEQEKLIALLKEKRQAVISHAVTKGLDPSVPMKDSGVEWLGEVPAHWEVSSLKRYWSVTDCKHITAEFIEDGIPLASIREVQSRFVLLDEAKNTTDYFFEQLIEGGRRPEPGDLIFSRNATVGEVAQVAQWHPPFAMGQDVCLLKKLNSAYSSDHLQLLIKSLPVVVQLENMMIGSTFKRINVEEIRNLILPMPPDNEQQSISEHLITELSKSDSLIAEAQSAITLLQERRTALISAAVTGQIKVTAD
ncbi:MAG: restriction endonuclease subunit S, partial [Leptothrix sp. (in: b-proteobacteria)]